MSQTNQTNSFINKLVETDEGKKLFHRERAIFEATELLCQIMEESGVTRAVLAERLGKTRGYVSQLLDGQSNMTIRTLSDAMFALRRTLHFQDGALNQSTAISRVTARSPQCGQKGVSPQRIRSR